MAVTDAHSFLEKDEILQGKETFRMYTDEYKTHASVGFRWGAPSRLVRESLCF